MLRKDVMRPSHSIASTADPSQVRRFEAFAEEWWKPNGKFKVIHAFNAARVAQIKQNLRPLTAGPADQPLAGLYIADVGCAAGLVSEALALAGARVVGIDASETSIAIARNHARVSAVDVDYRCALPEHLAKQGLRFDAVVCLEVIEHVSDACEFLKKTAELVRPGGRLILGTLNRTILSWFLAIVAAEYVLGWLPRGTHAWSRFVRPEESARFLSLQGFVETGRHGVVFNPLLWRWQISRRTSVNYLQILDRVA